MSPTILVFQITAGHWVNQSFKKFVGIDEGGTVGDRKVLLTEAVYYAGEETLKIMLVLANIDVILFLFFF